MSAPYKWTPLSGYVCWETRLKNKMLSGQRWHHKSYQDSQSREVNLLACAAKSMHKCKHTNPTTTTANVPKKEKDACQRKEYKNGTIATTIKYYNKVSVQTPYDKNDMSLGH